MTQNQQQMSSPVPSLSTSRLNRRIMLRRSAAIGASFGFGSGMLGSVSAQDASPVAVPNSDVKAEHAIEYGNVQHHSLLLDVYLPPPRSKPRPAVLLFHGGGWTYGISGPSDMAAPAIQLATAGYVAFNVEYRLTADPAAAYTWPDQLDDVQRAVRWVRANAAHYGVDPDRIGTFGHSAGAHLAAILAVRETHDDSDPALTGISSRVSCAVTLAGPMDFTMPYLTTNVQDSLTSLLGGTLKDVPNTYRDASPLTWVDEASSPFIMIQGREDEIVPPDHARRMVDALHAAGVWVVYNEIPKADHFLVADWNVCGPWTLTFFDTNLHPFA